MKLPAWLTGPKLPPLWDRAETVRALLVLAWLPHTTEFAERAGELYDARIGDPRNPLTITVEIVQTLRREFT